MMDNQNKFHGYTIKEYARCARRSERTIRLWIKNGRLVTKMVNGKNGLQRFIFPNGIPSEEKKDFTPNCTGDFICHGSVESVKEGMQSSNEIFTREQLLELVKGQGELKVLREENKFLREQLIKEKSYFNVFWNNAWKAINKKFFG